MVIFKSLVVSQLGLFNFSNSLNGSLCVKNIVYDNFIWYMKMRFKIEIIIMKLKSTWKFSTE